MKSKAIRIVNIAALLCALVACEERGTPVTRPSEVKLETRTFTLEGVSPLEAANVIDAYVYRDRPVNPGMISADRNMLSVRETADNLDRIGRVIDELNAGAGTPPETTLHFQLVEADGASESDPRIADVEAQLRKVLRFDGYRLLGEAFVTTQGGSIDQPIRTPDGRSYRIQGSFGEGYEVTGDNINVVDSNRELSLTFSTGETVLLDHGSASGKSVLLRSTVNIRDGQTIVLGSARAPGFTRTDNDGSEYHPGPQVILILRAEESAADGNA